METLLNFPSLVFVISFVALALAGHLGAWFRRGLDIDEDRRADMTVVLTAILTLLGLIIGFSFSMSVSRYDQRKNYEEEEANAIGTEYLRAELLPAADAAKVKALLRSYLDQRVRFYQKLNSQQEQEVSAHTAQLQGELWSAVKTPAAAQPTPISALVVSGMNDVLNSQGYTQAAWWNRIPVSAWALMGAIAVFSNLLLGYTWHQMDNRLFLILPFALAISFFLIADIDSPRGGTIRVHPQNLESLSLSLHRQ